MNELYVHIGKRIFLLLLIQHKLLSLIKIMWSYSGNNDGRQVNEHLRLTTPLKKKGHILTFFRLICERALIEVFRNLVTVLNMSLSRIKSEKKFHEILTLKKIKIWSVVSQEQLHYLSVLLLENNIIKQLLAMKNMQTKICEIKHIEVCQPGSETLSIWFSTFSDSFIGTCKM